MSEGGIYYRIWCSDSLKQARSPGPGNAMPWLRTQLSADRTRRRVTLSIIDS